MPRRRRTAKPLLLTMVRVSDPSTRFSVALAARTTTVGRNSSPCFEHGDHPYMASRAHLCVTLMPHGGPVLRDLASLNGTYVCRHGDDGLRRLSPKDGWRLKDGDTIGVGGPESVLTNGNTVLVANRLTFRVHLSGRRPPAQPDDVCPVCLSPPTRAVSMVCGHAYCGACADAMLDRMRAPCCALCRGPMRPLIED